MNVSRTASVLAFATFATRVAEQRDEARWIDPDRAMRCVEPDCRTLYEGLRCPRCTSSNGLPIAPLIDVEARPFEENLEAEHARALASVGMPGEAA